MTFNEPKMLEYEESRVARYKGYSQDVYYSQSEFDSLYRAWAGRYAGTREPEWDAYCDARDRVRRGTNEKIRKERIANRYQH